MRKFIRRFRRAVQTIPRRVRWMLIAPVAFIVMFAIDGHFAITVFFAVFAWLVIRELVGTSRSNQDDDWDASASRAPREADRRAIPPFGEDLLPFGSDVLDGMINPDTGLIMSGGFDSGGNAFGYGGHDDC